MLAKTLSRQQRVRVRPPAPRVLLLRLLLLLLPSPCREPLRSALTLPSATPTPIPSSASASASTPPPRSDDLIRWVKKKTGPATSDVATVAALEEVKAEGIFLLAYLPKLEGKDFDAYVAGED